jgi:hypothetical protein
MKTDDVQREIDRMTENLKAGGEVMSGDGGYKEVPLSEIKPSPYAELFKKQEMERLIKLANQAGSTHKQSLGVYQFYEHELREFADLLLLEAIKHIDPLTGDKRFCDQTHEEFWKNQCVHLIKSNFGLK